MIPAIGALLVAGLAWTVGSGRVPLGVRGEWEWLRVEKVPAPAPVGLALLAIGLYSAFVAAGFRRLEPPDASPRRELGWLAGLAIASGLVQGMVQEAAPEGYGLSKWIFALRSPGSSGYYTVARDRMADVPRFLADYPEWIGRQDALHVGTHPPGLFLTMRAILGWMEANPRLAKVVADFAPGSAASAIHALRGEPGFGRAEASTLTLAGALTLLACASTVVPLYMLARSSLAPSAAWASAALWPLLPSALMFQPAADSAFPLLSTSALALAAWSGRVAMGKGLAFSTLAGLVLALGMEFTLAFLPVGLVVALIDLTAEGRPWRHRAGMILATGAGFLAGTLAWWAATSANPFAIWWANQRNHARFYVEYPRNYLAWVVENPVELAVGLGLPSVAWMAVGLGRRGARVAWLALAVLALLTLSGKNLSEVGRLWLPLMPPLLVAAGSGFERAAAQGGSLAATVGLVGIQVLVLESMIQVVYPI